MIQDKFGGLEKVECSEPALRSLLNQRVVRIIGSYSEGSGFPVNEHQIITSFHVIEGDPSPKIVFPDGHIATPTKISGNSQSDVALITVDEKLKPLATGGALGVGERTSEPVIGESVYAAGYALGSQILGRVVVSEGSYSGKGMIGTLDISSVLSDISLVPGMSGGPLVDACGFVLGINTEGLAGLSVYVDAKAALDSTDLTGREIAKIEIDTSTPKGVVESFYTYIKARDLENAYNLVSDERLDGKLFEEWVQGYANTLNVNLIDVKVDEEDENKIFVKLESQDWVNGGMELKYFEGYWIVGGDQFKLLESNIAYIEDPSFEWFYSWEE